jgi:hypothetical protein
MAYKDRAKALEYYRQYNAKRRAAERPISARQAAMNAGEIQYSTGEPCVNGHLSPRSTQTRICMECDRLRKSKKRLANPELYQEKGRKYYAENRQKALDHKKIYRQANKGKIIALATLRKKTIKQRTPKWLTKDDLWMIKEAYELAALRTKMFGFSWHVDHVIPLQGKNVTGLHVPTNMQVIPGSMNISKKNKYEVDHV